MREQLSVRLGDRLRRAAATPAERPGRFYLLDILRGLAALSVVVWHYQHFFYAAVPGTPMSLQRNVQPFYETLRLLYEYGHRAVWLFFMLSGFVFFDNYAEALATRAVNAHNFFVLRFSRLYPLHLVMLLMVACGQYLSVLGGKGFVIYPNNDLYHFALNLVFASHWGLDRGFSFNGPEWSISLEVVLYIVFFLTCRFIARGFYSRLFVALGIVFLGLLFARYSSAPYLTEFMTALGYFFAGGVIFMGWRLATAWPRSQYFFAIGAMLVAAFGGYQLYRSGGIVTHYELLMFAGMIGALALLQRVNPHAGRRLRVIGDITYATYLIHFPIQLYTILAIRGLGAQVDFRAPLAFLIFGGAVIGLGIVVYYRFELPAQNYLRRVLLRPRSGKAS